MHAAKLAEDIADLLAPQSGAYYDIWLDGEKYVSSQMEVRAVLTRVCQALLSIQIQSPELVALSDWCLKNNSRRLIGLQASHRA